MVHCKNILKKFRGLTWCLVGLSFLEKTRGTQTPIKFRTWFLQKVVGFNRTAYWPVHFTSIVSHSKNIIAGIETCPGYMPGCYIQGYGKIFIGDYTQIGPNVGLISSNHSTTSNQEYVKGEIRIGKYCWIGMGAVVLPNVTLGDFTVVGAGAIVTKSFAEGHCVIGGNPAKIIKTIDSNECVRHRSKTEYNGYIPSPRFAKFRERKLSE